LKKRESPEGGYKQPESLWSFCCSSKVQLASEEESKNPLERSLYSDKKRRLKDISTRLSTLKKKPTLLAGKNDFAWQD